MLVISVMPAPFRTSIMRPAKASERAWSNDGSAMATSRTAGANLDQSATNTTRVIHDGRQTAPARHSATGACHPVPCRLTPRMHCTPRPRRHPRHHELARPLSGPRRERTRPHEGSERQRVGGQPEAGNQMGTSQARTGGQGGDRQQAGRRDHTAGSRRSSCHLPVSRSPLGAVAVRDGLA